MAAETRVPRISAMAVEKVATLRLRSRGGQMSGRLHATANHFRVRPGGGKAKERSSVVKA